jgi:cation diffusion facilitator family transporter
MTASGNNAGLADHRARKRAAVVSLVVGALLFLAKYQAWRLTGSTAVLSDAMESTVNVVAAIFAIIGIGIAAAPADRSHPYGHGKIEFFAAAFEGGLIAAAAVLIIREAVIALFDGEELRKLDVGLAITLAAGLANAALGCYLVTVGRRTNSLTLVADGKHVLADFWTSAGVIVGLLLVQLTGLVWLDPLAAVLVACWLLWTGVGLVRTAAAGLLDEHDPSFNHRIVEIFDGYIGLGVIRMHHLRAIRAGHFHHVSAHLVVPEFWTVDRSHELAESLAERLISDLGVEGEVTYHTDPCHRAYCRMCDVEECSARLHPFSGQSKLTVEEAIRPDPPRVGS